MDIRFENLQKSFDGRKVLDINEGFIKSGSITAIIGPNGAGKSTLLNIIAGLENADSGFIRYGGSAEGAGHTQGDSADFPQKDITLVFQKPYLISTTVEKNIAYPMRLRGFDEATIDRRITALLEELNLMPFRKQKSWKLSGGETQKVALARALSFGPRLLLLDEPTANIDPYTTAEIEKLLLSTNEKHNTTIVIVTHNLAQAKRLCSDAIMLHEGQLIESGSCQKMLTAPQNEKTIRFISGELLI